uniref:Uncharacterized protein n=1 Tax=Anopheles merus TaxID=30066 RepID=A0A182UPF4_ANOME
MEAVVNRLQQTICGDEDGSSPSIPEDFTLQPVRSEDELNDMERKLSDNQYMKNGVAWLHNNITARNMDKRLNEVKDLELDATFVLHCPNLHIKVLLGKCLRVPVFKSSMLAE